VTSVRRHDAVLLSAGLVALAVVPFLVGDFRVRELSQMGVYFIAILGLNLLTGYTGQISLGHGAFMSIGGYTTAILVADHGIPDWATVPLAGLAAGIAGLAFGVPALRLSGLYLALVTFGMAVALPALQRKFPGLTGGSTGLQLDFHSGRWNYALAWPIALGLLAAAWLLVRSRVGRAFRALRDSEVAATAMGVSAARYKTLAFGVSALYAGVAGSLFAIDQAYVVPETYPVQLSFFLLAGAAIAGLGGLAGIAFGAAFLTFVERYASDVAESLPSVIFGGLLVLVMILFPSGVAGLFERFTNRGYTRPR
jgi:branched-chain amino acid transport system permease protein